MQIIPRKETEKYTALTTNESSKNKNEKNYNKTLNLCSFYESSTRPPHRPESENSSNLLKHYERQHLYHKSRILRLAASFENKIQKNVEIESKINQKEKGKRKCTESEEHHRNEKAIKMRKKILAMKEKDKITARDLKRKQMCMLKDEFKREAEAKNMKLKEEQLRAEKKVKLKLKKIQHLRLVRERAAAMAKKKLDDLKENEFIKTQQMYRRVYIKKCMQRERQEAVAERQKEKQKVVQRLQNAREKENMVYIL